MIGQRLRTERKLRNLKQNEVGSGIGVSRETVCYWENGKKQPSGFHLIKLAEFFGHKKDYFLHPAQLTLHETFLRAKQSFPKAHLNLILLEVRKWLEKSLEVEEFLFGSKNIQTCDPAILDSQQIGSHETAYSTALQLRKLWCLGESPIRNMTDLLEEHGIRIAYISAPTGFDACCLQIAWNNQRLPVIIINSDFPGDRQRFDLAHELGHLLLKPSDNLTDRKKEDIVHRFASAFLIPTSSLGKQLGTQRNNIHTYELKALKMRYGVSMQALIIAAFYENIITLSTSNRLFLQFAMKGWRKREPGKQLAPERSTRLPRLIMKAVSEGIISKQQASELFRKIRMSIRFDANMTLIREGGHVYD